MTKVTNDDIKHLASLSALALEPGEIEELRLDVEHILGFVEQLSTLDTDGVEPTYQVTGLESVFRADEIDQNTVPTEQLLDLAPDRDGSSIKVPKVL